MAMLWDRILDTESPALSFESVVSVGSEVKGKRAAYNGDIQLLLEWA